MSILSVVVVSIAILAALASLIIEATIAAHHVDSGRSADDLLPVHPVQTFDAYLAEFLWLK